MNKAHHYELNLEWTGNTGDGTSAYTSYERSHCIQIQHKAIINASSDPAFRGDKTKHNPEELLLASVASCHMLWFLHLCSAENVIVTGYTDHATGVMKENENGSGKFTSIVLFPSVIVKEDSMKAKAMQLTKEQMNFVSSPIR